MMMRCVYVMTLGVLLSSGARAACAESSKHAVKSLPVSLSRPGTPTDGYQQASDVERSPGISLAALLNGGLFRSGSAETGSGSFSSSSTSSSSTSTPTPNRPRVHPAPSPTPAPPSGPIFSPSPSPVFGGRISPGTPVRRPTIRPVAAATTVAASAGAAGMISSGGNPAQPSLARRGGGGNDDGEGGAAFNKGLKLGHVGKLGHDGGDH